MEEVLSKFAQKWSKNLQYFICANEKKIHKCNVKLCKCKTQIIIQQRQDCTTLYYQNYYILQWKQAEEIMW